MRNVIAIAALFAASGFGANSDNPSRDHNDAFMPGPDNETQIAKQVRHKLLTLPYYSIFDDLAFRVNGSVVTLEGACPGDPPWDIKSDAGEGREKGAGRHAGNQ